MSELQLKAEQLAEMVGLIEDGTISGKIAKQILPDLLQAWHICIVYSRDHIGQQQPALRVATSTDIQWH